MELIKNASNKIDKAEIVGNNHLFSSIELKLEGSIEFQFKNFVTKILNDTIQIGNNTFSDSPNFAGGTIHKLINEPIKIIYLSSELITNDAIDVFNQKPLELITALAETRTQKKSRRFESESFLYEFSSLSTKTLWIEILSNILTYRDRFTQFASELLNKGVVADLSRMNKQYEQWSKNNKHPLTMFAETVNPILNKLNIEIDLINTEYAVPIKATLNDRIIPTSQLSTGTKSLLFSLYPLFQLDTNNSIILVDEPERSLFPDVQMEIISLYQKLAPNAQIIVATHSPFIAASFEPEERFILFIDEKGNINVKNGISPRGDDPNDITREDFNVDYYNKYGKEAFNRYLMLKQKLQQENDDKIKKSLILELAELGDKYNF